MKNKIIEIYTVDNDYVNFLRKYDQNVMINAKDISKLDRPYVGVVLDLGKYLYFAPLTHEGTKWIGYYDHIVLAKGELGAIKIGRMIPIPKALSPCLISMIIRSTYLNSLNNNERKYGLLLFNQYREINKLKTNHIIIQKVLEFYKYGICYKYTCNFKLLEKAADLWSWKYDSIIKIISFYTI